MVTHPMTNRRWIYREYGMTPERYNYLWDSDDGLTEDEINNGWYFSREYEGLLVNEAWPGHKRYKGSRKET